MEDGGKRTDPDRKVLRVAGDGISLRVYGLEMWPAETLSTGKGNELSKEAYKLI
jgi:hypothetical protein